ncbi:DNA sulfur modification protein DndE [Trabulsiella odontotermitis]|uniref:DNA sulfur modification protein DndE n=1 Tax=Trabulsiella odontotermitis TaxID=379893 RepID=UPI0006BA2536|nr:DNA sulfur modification protein DndE [Trabulsiella odontotermitis]
MSIEHVRLSEKAKQQLITLKRRTGIENWNVLCRWAFCLSLSEKAIPPHEDIMTDSSVEMTWKTFSGEQSEIYLALLKQRVYEDYKDHPETVDMNYLFKLHLHRGISYMLNRVHNLDDMIFL